MILKKKGIFICIIAVLFAVFGVVFSNAAEGDAASIMGSLDSGRDFVYADKLELQRDFESMPKTYEAVIYVPESKTTMGVIIGNYIRESRSSFVFRISAEGKPQLQIIDENINTVLNTFDCDIRGEEWVHVAITHEVLDDGALFRCYVNGELVGTNKTDVSYDLDMSIAQSAVTPYLGKDFRNEYYFKGRIKNLALYTEALSAEEIKASFDNGVGTHTENLLACYDLTDADGSNAISDLTQNGYDFAPQYFERTEEKNDYAYSFAVIGDTQYLVYKDAHSGTSYTSYIYDWIVQNKEKKNIQFVMGLGDITDKDGYDNSKDSVDQTDVEWTIAKAQYDKLTAAGIPYTVISGNHDTVPQLDKFFARTDNFSALDIEYFDGTSLGNYFVRFTVEETKYMILCLDYHLAADSDEMLWANTAIEQNTDCKVIITTHHHLNYDASRSVEDGMNIWDGLVTYNKNVIMVLSGHIGKIANTVKRTSVGAAGHTVTEILVDPQYLDTNYVYKNVGMVGMLYFSADGKEVDFEYISTQATLTAQSADESAQDVFYGCKNQFSFTISDEPELVTTKYGVITNSEWADSSAYPFVIFDESGNCLGAAANFYGTTTATSAIGIARTHLSNNTWEDGKPTGTVRTATILMRADHSLKGQYYDNISQLKGLVTVDLNGYTLSASTSTYYNNTLVRVKLKTTGYPTEMVFKNGDINLYHLPLFLLYGNVSGKEFGAEFENINFAVNGAMSSFVASYTTTEYDIYPAITFTDCVVDLSGSTASSVTLFDVGNDLVNITVTVSGGNIISGGTDFTVFGKTSEATEGKLVFAEYEGAYTKLTLPSGTEIATETLSNGTDNLVFAKYSTDGSEDVYRLTYEYVETKYGKIPAEYTFMDLYPFVVFNENGECFFGSDNFYTAVNNAKNYMKYNAYDGTVYSYNGSSARACVLLLRCDYTIASTAYYDNVSQIRGTIIIDLDGYTLTRAGSDALMRSTMKAWTDNSSGDGRTVFPTELIFKNGSIDIKNGSLAKYSASAEGKELIYGFIDINFTVTGTSSSFAAVHNSSNGLGLKPEMYFENCVIDITEAGQQTITLFDLGDESTFLDVRLSGCEIIANNTEFTLFGKTDDTSTGSMVISYSADAHNSLTIPNAVDLPEISGVEFVKVSETGDSATYAIKPVEIEDIDFTLKSSITLDSNLVYNVYIPVISGLKSFTLDGVSYTDLASLENVVTLSDGEQYYRFEIGLSASEAARDITLKAVLTVGGKDCVGSFTMSIIKYAAKVINSGNEIEAQLVKDVLSYIRAAYAYFDETDAEAMARIDTLLGDNYDADNSPVFDGSAEAPTMGLNAVTSVLGSTPAIRFYISDTSAEYEFFVNGVKLAMKEGSDGEGAYIEMDVYAYAMCETVTYRINGIESGSYHINSYYNFVTTDEEYKNDAELINLVERFAKYCESAKVYRNYVLSQNSEN